MSMLYEFILTRNPKTKTWHFENPGCGLEADGKTAEEAMRGVSDRINEYLDGIEACRELERNFEKINPQRIWKYYQKMTKKLKRDKNNVL